MKYYTADEVALVMHVSTSTVRSWIRAGLPTVDMPIVRSVDLDAWVVARPPAPAGPTPEGLDILRTLRSTDEWMSRRGLGACGAPRIAQALDRLVDARLVQFWCQEYALTCAGRTASYEAACDALCVTPEENRPWSPAVEAGVSMLTGRRSPHRGAPACVALRALRYAGYIRDGKPTESGRQASSADVESALGEWERRVRTQS